MTAITFPRSMPDELLVAGLSFYPDPMIETTPLRSGRSIAKDLGPTLWRGKWQSTQLDTARFDQVRAWYATITNIQAFYGYDKARQYPAAYPGGFGGLTYSGGAFSGTCKIDSVDSNNVVLNLKELPTGFVLSVGDYLCFDYATDSRALHRVVAAGTAGSDGKVVVEVRPNIRTGASSDIVVTFYRAAAKMMVIPGTYSEQTTPPNFGQISFEAIQTI